MSVPMLKQRRCELRQAVQPGASRGQAERPDPLQSRAPVA